jgi:Na+/proline symporter
MLIVGTAFVQDMWHVAKPMGERKLIPRTRWTIFAYCTLLYTVTLYPPGGIVEMTAFSGAVFAASFFPAIFGGLYLRWGTDVGALLSMLTGIIGCVVWRFGFRFELEGLSDIHEIIPAFLISSLVYIVASMVTSKRAPEKAHLDRIFA